MYRIAIVVLVGVIAGLCGCLSPEGQRELAIQKGMARCESMGKQFLLRNVETMGNGFTTKLQTVLEFACVGPGDEGYVPPA